MAKGSKINDFSALFSIVPDNMKPEKQDARRNQNHKKNKKNARRTTGGEGSVRLKKEKSVYAAYTSMARMNIYHTLVHITERIGCSLYPDDSKVNSSDDSTIGNLTVISGKGLLPEMQADLQRLLCHHFPFFNLEGDKKKPKSFTLNQMRKTLKHMAAVISNVRNYALHHYSNATREWDCENKVGRFILNDLWAQSVMDIKKRYSSATNKQQKGMINENSLKPFQKLGNQDKNGSEDPNKTHFLYPLCEENGNKGLSDMGVVWLVCLFLQKRYANEFIQKIGLLDYFKEESEKDGPELSKQTLLLDILTCRRIRRPEARLHTDKNSVQVCLDILNELKKCPPELRDYLKDEDIDRFAVYSRDNERVELRRSGDRFPYLLLSYWDTTKAFSNIFFQINMGKYRYLKKEDKNCIDNIPRVIVLQEDLNGFGRLQYAESKRKTLWPGIEIKGYGQSPKNDASCLPYISDVYTHYIFNGDNIGISFEEYLPKEIIVSEDSKVTVRQKKPDCWISRFELPAMAFHYYLTSNQSKNGVRGDATQKLIKDYVDNYRRFLDSLKNNELQLMGDLDAIYRFIEKEYGIRKSDIPDKLRSLFKDARNSLTVEERKANAVAEMIEDTDKRIKVSEEKTLRSGDVATFLAKDILLFQKVGKPSDKMTGLDYKIFQSLLATYCPHNSKTEVYTNQKDKALRLTDPAEFQRLFEKKNIMETHAFLKKVFKNRRYEDLITFYKAYLKERKAYLEDKGNDMFFLYPGRRRWQDRNEDYYRQLIDDYDAAPIFLPRQLFLDAIKKLIEENNGIIADHANSAYLINRYFEEVRKDGPQEFYSYDYKCNYRLYSLVRDNLEDSRSILEQIDKEKESAYRKYLGTAIEYIESNKPIIRKTGKKQDKEELRTALRKAFLAMSDNEKTLRRLRVQDMVLYMLCMDGIAEDVGMTDKDVNEFKLKDVGPDGKGVLDLRLSKIIIDYTASLISDGKLYSGKAKVSHTDVRIKDYGEIFKILNDPRANYLILELLQDMKQDHEFSLARMSEELNLYDEKRVGVFDSLHEYEEKLKNVLSESSVIPLSKDDKYISFDKVQNYDEEMSAIRKQVVRMIRNAFAHNQYPPHIVYEDMKDQGKGSEELYSGSNGEVIRIIVAKLEEYLKTRNQS